MFIKMLITAVEKQDPSIFLDLLSYQDLENLKKAKN